MVANSQRCHIQNMAEIRPKIEGVVNFAFLKNLSTNLYDTFQKCTLYTRKVHYYHTLKSKGVMWFMTPYDTFMTPCNSLSALKYSLMGIFMTPFKQRSCHPALQADSQAISSMQGVIKPICFVLKGVIKGVAKKYDTFHSEQEVLPWQF